IKNLVKDQQEISPFRQNALEGGERKGAQTGGYPLMDPALSEGVEKSWGLIADRHCRLSCQLVNWGALQSRQQIEFLHLVREGTEVLLDSLAAIDSSRFTRSAFFSRIPTHGKNPVSLHLSRGEIGRASWRERVVR